MPRKKFIKSTLFYYHVYNRSNHGFWYSCPLDKVWDISLSSIELANQKHPVIISQFVLMNNHYHMLIKTPLGNLPDFMYEFGKSFSLKLRVQTNLKNKMFSGRYKWSLISDEKYLQNVHNYIYQNPVLAGISENSLHYKYSTNFKRKENFRFNFQDIYHQKAYNQKVVEIKPDLIRRGLKKQEFRPVKK